MTKLKTILTIGAGVIGLVVYVKRLKRTGAELEAEATGMIHSLNTNGLTFRLDVNLKNPTNGSFKLKYPYVKLYYGDTLLGSSQVINKDITLPKNGEARIEQIMLTIPATKLLSIGNGFYKLISDKKNMDLTVQTLTSIDLGWKNNIPFKKSNNISIQAKS